VRTSGNGSAAASLAHSPPKASQASAVTGRGPSSDHIAISTAPVSDAGTIAMRWSGGTASTSRVRSMASFSRARLAAARCERPTRAPSSTAGDQPGRLAQGPVEKRGLPGRRLGLGTLMTVSATG
jgi:hypothetical protein